MAESKTGLACKDKPKFNREIDEKFLEHFSGRLKQVFLYVTDECQLRCRQCLYKPNLVFHMKHKEIPLETAISLLEDMYQLGARKLTIMGGEPSLYGSDSHSELCELVERSRKCGYEYIRMDSNGQYEDDFLALPLMQTLDDISFSLDGHTEAFHDVLRGEGAFKKCVHNIERAVSLGYKVDVTSCVHSELARPGKDGSALNDLIQFVAGLGCRRINFHVLFKHGFPMDTWTEDTALSVDQWIELHKEIYSNIEKSKYSIEVRLPRHFVTKEDFRKKPDYYGYCAVKLGERVLIHPNQRIRVCSGLISSEYAIADYNDQAIRWNESGTNELLDHNCEECTPCTNQSKSMETGGYLPLCFSFKEKQSEYVWNKLLKWDV